MHESCAALSQSADAAGLRTHRNQQTLSQALDNFDTVLQDFETVSGTFQATPVTPTEAEHSGQPFAGGEVTQVSVETRPAPPVLPEKSADLIEKSAGKSKT